MTSLIVYTDNEQVAVGTDTLATTKDGTPALFTTKAYPLPHLSIVIVGTGMQGFLSKWFLEINDTLRTSGIDNLDVHTPDALRALWAEYKSNIDYDFPDDLTTTVYHFGFSEQDGSVKGYAYRSNNGFSSNPLQTGGFLIKPECTVPSDWELPRDFVTMMEEQRTIQASRPHNERIFIGGEIQFVHLTKQEISILTVHRFEEYERDFTTIMQN